MKSINKVLSLIIIFSSLVATVKAQETMYIYKDGAIVGEHILADVDSVIFYKAEVPEENTVIDIDGNIYNTVVIGTQTWMAENLKTTSYNDGTPIPLETDATTWSQLTSGAYCWYDNNEENYKELYGALYNWYTVETGKVCPEGWHVPYYSDWQTLESYLIGLGYINNSEGNALKATNGWGNDGNGIDFFEFGALPGGYRGEGINGSEAYNYAGYSGRWWSNTAYNSNNAYNAGLYYFDGNLELSGSLGGDKWSGFSVRCIKD